MTADAPKTWDTERLPEGEEKVRAVRDMFDAIAPRYDLVNRVMTFRLDVRWRRTAVKKLALPRGSVVADLASGTGDLCIDLVKAGIVPVSIDLSFGMLSADRSGAPRAQADILRLPIPDGALDGVTCGFALRNLADLPTFFAEIARVTRPGGRVALLDVGIPHNPVVRKGNDIYFGKVVPKIALVSTPTAGGPVCTRSFIPHACHDAIGVFAAVTVATACVLPGTPAAAVARMPAGRERTISVEHPTGEFSVRLVVEGPADAPVVTRAGLLRTARKLFDGHTFLPEAAALALAAGRHAA